jgi:hypothetical protein
LVSVFFEAFELALDIGDNPERPMTKAKAKAREIGNKLKIRGKKHIIYWRCHSYTMDRILL